jgi:tRNA pseudouridine38-40 synthase
VETTFRLTLEYDGADFDGWQVQTEGSRTIQGCLEDAVAQVCGRRVRVDGSGRTDAGVHASGQVASLRIETRFDAEGLRRALNGVLPADVAVVASSVAADGFHARYDARAKRYVYRIWNGPNRSPLRAARSHWVAPALDLAAMRAAAPAFVGRRDFASLQAAGSDIEQTVRTLLRLDLPGESRGEIEIQVEGDGFLRHMVRNLAGTLIEVGLGRRPSDGIAELLERRDRRLAGPTAPAHGLELVRVSYSDSA